MKNRICVIFTGGTIGSRVCGDTVDLRNEEKSFLLELYRGRFGNDTEFDEYRPLNILSENIQPSDLEIMACCLRKVKNNGYKGVIITQALILCVLRLIFSVKFSVISNYR